MFLCDDQGFPGPLPPLRGRADRLGLRVPLHADEPVAGYLARLAARAGHPTIRSCLSQSLPGELTLRDVLDGKRQDEVCAMFDLPEGAFQPATPKRVRGRRWTIGRELRLPPGFVSFDAVRACPQCLAADELHSGVGAQRRVEPHVRTFWAMPLVRACPTHGVQLIEVPGGLEGFASIARSDRRPAWSAIPTQMATDAETTLSRFIAGHFGFVAPVALPESTAWLAAAGLPTILSAAALIGFGMTGEPVEQATDKAWRRWIDVGLAWLLVEPLVNIVQVIAVRLPHLRQPPWQPAEPVVPDFLDVAPMTTLRQLRQMLPRPPADLAFDNSSGIGEVGDRAALTFCFDASDAPTIVGDRAIDAFLRPHGANARSARWDLADRLPPRLTRPGGAKLVAPASLLISYLSGV